MVSEESASNPPNYGHEPLYCKYGHWVCLTVDRVLACKYLLALRKHVTHTIEFKTSPQGLSLAPGDYIKVVTQANPFTKSRIGTVDSEGRILSIDDLPDGDYEVTYYTPGAEDIQRGTLTVENSVSTTLKNVVFSWGQATNTSGVYMVEQLTIDEELMVSVVASSFPVDDSGVSMISKDILAKDDNSIWAVSE